MEAFLQVIALVFATLGFVAAKRSQRWRDRQQFATTEVGLTHCEEHSRRWLTITLACAGLMGVFLFGSLFFAA